MSLVITLTNFANYGEAFQALVQEVEPYTRISTYNDFNSKKLRACIDEVNRIVERPSQVKIDQEFQRMMGVFEEALVSPIGPHRLNEDPVIDCGIGWEREHHRIHQTHLKTFRGQSLDPQPRPHLFAKAARLWLNRCQDLQKNHSVVIPTRGTSHYELVTAHAAPLSEMQIAVLRIMEDNAVAVLEIREWADRKVQQLQAETDEIRRSNAEQEALIAEDILKRSSEIEDRINALDRELDQVRIRAKAQEDFLLNKAKLLEEQITADTAAHKSVDEQRQKRLHDLKQEVDKVRTEARQEIALKTKHIEEQTRQLLASVEHSKQSTHQAMMEMSQNLAAVEAERRHREEALFRVQEEVRASATRIRALQHQTADLQGTIRYQERQIQGLREEIEDDAWMCVLQ